MLSDEEKKAVDKIKTLIQYLNVWKENFTIVPEDVKYLVTILNLIEKQSKEIERLNNKFEKIYNEIDNKNSQLVKALNYKLFMEDKIKAKIEEYDDKEMTVNRIAGKTFQRAVRNDVRKVLQSLSNEEE